MPVVVAWVFRPVARLGRARSTLSTQTVTFNGGTLALEINSSTLTRDTLAIVGDIILGGSPALTISDLGSATLPGGTILSVLTYTGNWDGQLLTWAGLLHHRSQYLSDGLRQWLNKNLQHRRCPGTNIADVPLRRRRPFR